MSAEDLKNVYGNGSTRSVLNRAIRAEFPGTSELIDLRTWLNARPDCPEKFKTCRVLDRYLRRCENSVRGKFGMAEIPIESDADDDSYE